MSFKKYKNKVFIVLFITVFSFILAGALWINPAKAACSIDCIGNTTGAATGDPVKCEYDIDVWTTDNKVCTVGNVIATTAIFSTVNPCINSDTNAAPSPNTQACRHDACPVFNYQNGAACKVMGASGALCGTTITATGIWDANESKCVLCSVKKEGGINSLCGDTSQVWTDAAGNCTGMGDNEFEMACDNTVALQCDEQVAGCVGTAGFCDTNGLWNACTFNNCSAGACPAVTVTPTVTSTITPTPTGAACPTLAPEEGCFSPGAKGENRYDPLTGGCKVFPVPCQLAYFCNNGVCKEPRSVFSMLTDGASFLASLLIGLALLVLVFGAIRYILAGITSETETAKKIILYAILGLIIGGASYAIISTIYSILKK